MTEKELQKLEEIVREYQILTYDKGISLDCVKTLERIREYYADDNDKFIIEIRITSPIEGSPKFNMYQNQLKFVDLLINWFKDNIADIQEKIERI